jgi:hypothetical protein
MGPAPYASEQTLLASMEEREQRLVQAMEDLENWAAGLRVHHDGIRWDIYRRGALVSVAQAVGTPQPMGSAVYCT